MTQTQPLTANELDLQNIEQQVLQKGAFCPLTWLLDGALLPYGDYERWRFGAVDHLDQALVCERDALTALLQNAEQHAGALKLVNDTQIYYDWRPERSARALSLSRDRELARLLSQRWVRPQDAPQLDLFMDNGAASAENELAGHLAGRRWREAEAAYTRLCEAAPNNAQLGSYETLVLYGKHLDANPAIEEPALAEELAGLEEDIAPLARDLLRDRARDYLAPAWQRLAKNLPSAHFDPQQPSLHASYAWAQIPDWPQVIECVVAVPDHREHFELLERLARALHYTGQQEASTLLWGYLFELSPESAERETDAQPIGPLRPLWQSFSDNEEPLSLSHFPAWILLREPGLVHHLEAAEHPVPAGNIFKATAALVRARASDDEMPAREALQALSPGLLRLYLSRKHPD